MSARLMMIVLAVGMSSPDSMIAEVTSTFVWPCMKASMVRSRAPSSICPCATAIVASGTSSESRRATASMFSTRLCTRKTCPPRASSRRIASRTTASS